MSPACKYVGTSATAMADVKPNPPRVVWESAVKTRGWRTRIVEAELFSTSSDAIVKKSYTLEVAKERDAMGAWSWSEANLEYDGSAVSAAVEALGSRCGCEGKRAEVPE